MKEQVLDSEALIDFGINMIQSAPKLWRIAGEVERQRLPTAIFPEGLSYDFVNGFGTAKTDDLYGVLQQFDAKSSNVVGAEATTFELVISELAEWFIDNPNTTWRQEYRQAVSTVIEQAYRY